MKRRMLVVALMVAAVGGCAMLRPSRPRPPRGARPRTVRMEVTAYCPCGSCCGWTRNWWGRPVYAYGPQRGQRKQVGVTASGTRARPGTLAADTRRFPFGTIMEIPGYGYGRVEDRGGAIQGNRLDVYFRSHEEALQWGRQHLEVRVWLPDS